jgi:hypothetical protein
MLRRSAGVTLSRMRRRLLFALLAAVTVGCRQVTPEQVQWRFARMETCPISRVSISEEEGEPTPKSLALRESTPPDDVASDPERLAMWTADRTRPWSRRTDIRVYQVSGCGSQEVVACYRIPMSSGRCQTLSTHHELPAETQRLIQEVDAEIAKANELLCSSPFYTSSKCTH